MAELVETAAGRPPHLNHAQLAVAQRETLAAPRRRYGIMARIREARFR